MKNEISRSSLFGAAAVVVAAALCFSYATYSWMTMDRSVKANGIKLNVAAPNSIEISLTGSDGDWHQDIEVTEDEIKELNTGQTVKNNYIMPASSYTGFDGSFYQSFRAQADGKLYSDTVLESGHGMQLSVNSTEYTGHYIDIPIYLRTADTTGKELYLEKSPTNATKYTSIHSPAGNTSYNLYKTARVAFLSEVGGALSANSAGENTPLVLADLSRDAAFITANGLTVYKTATTVGEPSYITWDADGVYSEQKIIDLQAAEYIGSTPTYHVSHLVMRIWIEGQDPSCVAEVGGQSFVVDIRFSVK